MEAQDKEFRLKLVYIAVNMQQKELAELKSLYSIRSDDCKTPAAFIRSLERMAKLSLTNYEEFAANLRQVKLYAFSNALTGRTDFEPVQTPISPPEQRPRPPPVAEVMPAAGRCFTDAEQHVIDHIGPDWRRLARYLKVPPREVAIIDADHRTLDGKSETMMLKWIHGPNANKTILMNALKRLPRYDIIADINNMPDDDDDDDNKDMGEVVRAVQSTDDDANPATITITGFDELQEQFNNNFGLG